LNSTNPSRGAAGHISVPFLTPYLRRETLGNQPIVLHTPTVPEYGRYIKRFAATITRNGPMIKEMGSFRQMTCPSRFQSTWQTSSDRIGILRREYDYIFAAPTRLGMTRGGIATGRLPTAVPQRIHGGLETWKPERPSVGIELCTTNFGPGDQIGDATVSPDGPIIRT